MLKFKQGQIVRQILPQPITGRVKKIEVVGDEIAYLVDTGDDTPPRWFREDQIEAVQDAPSN